MPAAADDRQDTDQTIDLRDEHADRLAELIAHLTDCEPEGALAAVANGYRPALSADEALRLTARAMVELRDTTPASVRVAPYLGRLRHRPGDRPVTSGPAVRTDRFELRVHHVAHRPLRLWDRPTGIPGPGRTVTG
jgi:hypothetical protein